MAHRPQSFNLDTSRWTLDCIQHMISWVQAYRPGVTYALWTNSVEKIWRLKQELWITILIEMIGMV